jgi:hypothetical protein
VKRFGLLLVTVILAGCTSFEKDWNSASTATTGGIAGRWVGTWQNTNNTHGGVLKAVLKPDGTNEFAARFYAEWGSHSGSFKTTLRGHFENDTFLFDSSKRIMGFKITTRGNATPTDFFATYSSRFDNGTFTLKRPEN